MIYTRNNVEALHRKYRKVTKAKGAFPMDDALKKVLYLATLDFKEPFRSKRDRPMLLGQLKKAFGECVQDAAI
jgi:putative transposase